MKRSLLFTLLLGLILTFAPSAFADDWFTTGSSVRVKSLGFINVNVYTITHEVKANPEARPKKDRGSIIDADGYDKRFTLTMMRDVPQKKIREAFLESFTTKNRINDARTAQWLTALKDDGPDIDKGKHIWVTYNAAGNGMTTLAIEGGGKQSIPGKDFQKHVWKIWFGEIDQRSMGDQLMVKL